MTDTFVDPGPPGEPPAREYMKSKDLINKPLIILPTELRHDGNGKDNDGNPKAYDYVNAEVWVIDRAGVVEHGEDVQFSWVRVIPQLTDRLGKFVLAKPVVDADNSRILVPLSPEAKEVAGKAIAEIRAEKNGRADQDPPIPPELAEHSDDVF